MQNGVNAAAANPPAACSGPQERILVWLFCLLGAVHVFVFSAAVPFFNNVDEPTHFDLVVKYSQGHIPRGLELVSEESSAYTVIFASQEFLWPSNSFPAEKFPPPWTLPIEQSAPRLQHAEAQWAQVKNYEASQPPLYYTLAGAWWRLGRICGFHDGFLLYGLRFLNIFFVILLVWLGHAAARLVFPDRPFLRLGVPAWLAFLPQSTFYSIQNDVLSPLTFGAAFILLVRLMRSDGPSVRLGTATGLALAATFLTKLSNLPLLAVSGVVVLFKMRGLAKTRKLRAAGPALASLGLCAGLPMIAWLAWCKYTFGDFTGTAQKIRFLGWTYQPFAGWWRHPIFTPHGGWTFWSGLMAEFWQGEYLWHRQPLASPVVDVIYALLSAGLVGMTVAALFFRSTRLTGPQRQALWLGFWCFSAAVAFLGFLSIRYDFQDCFNPSRAHPYFTSGRLMLGALIPFALLFLYGLDRALGGIKKPWARPLVLAGLILFMLVSEILINRVMFPSAYNWYHM